MRKFPKVDPTFLEDEVVIVTVVVSVFLHGLWVRSWW